MFQFTSTVILNSATDSSGKPKWTQIASAGAEGPSLDVKRVNRYYQAYTKAIYKRAGNQPTLGQADITAAQWGAGIYRLKLYIRLSGSENSLFSNDMVYKGKPLYFEFSLTGSESATEVAEKIVKAVNKSQIRFDYKYIDIANAAEEVTIMGLDEYQVFKEVKIERYLPMDSPCACASDCVCDFETILDATITPTVQGFGTYTQIVKDLRLPTMTANNFVAVNQEERPVPGLLYNQYTIQYVKERGVLGTDGVGDLVTSGTTHVFFVPTTLATQWETDLATIGTIVTV